MSLLYWYGIGLFIGLNFMDVYLTNLVIRNGGREENIALQLIMKHTGKYWGAVKLAIALLAAVLLIYIGPSILSGLVLSALVVAYIYVVSHNNTVYRAQLAKEEMRQLRERLSVKSPEHPFNYQ